ncbi:MAG: hypothetical protein WCP92_04835 [bacterium]
MYANLSLTIPAIPHAISQEINHQNNIHSTYFIFAPAYRHIIKPTIARIITVPKSGINKNIMKNIALSNINDTKKSLVFTLSRFLINRHHKNNTYHNLKNSAGCILPNHGIFIHPLAPLSTIPIPGINTDICRNIKITAIMVIFLFFWKNFIGMA